jgi:hypothetical protein
VGGTELHEKLLDDTLDIFDNIIVPEAQHAKLLRLQPLGTLAVVFHAFRVLAAVKLDDEPGRQAGEVRDIATNRNLAPKPETFELLGTQIAPQAPLGIGRIPAKRAGALDGHHAASFTVNGRAKDAAMIGGNDTTTTERPPTRHR